MRRYLLPVLGLILLAGCAAGVLPEEALQEVDPSADFEQVKSDPERYKGTTLLLGGRIVGNEADAKGSTLEVLRYGLDRWGYPTDVDETGGRFLARIDRFLDPEVYAKDRFIVLTGTLEGVRVKELNGVPYRYPVFAIRAGKVFQRSTALPYGYPYPYYRPYGYDPFWYDPFWYDPWYPGSRWYRNDPFWYRR